MSRNDTVVAPPLGVLFDDSDNGAKGRGTVSSSRLSPTAAVDINVGSMPEKSIVIIGVGIVIIISCCVLLVMILVAELVVLEDNAAAVEDDDALELRLFLRLLPPWGDTAEGAALCPVATARLAKVAWLCRAIVVIVAELSIRGIAAGALKCFIMMWPLLMLPTVACYCRRLLSPCLLLWHAILTFLLVCRS